MTHESPAPATSKAPSPCAARDLLVVFPAHDADGLAKDVISRFEMQADAPRVSVLCLWLEPIERGAIPWDRVAWSFAEPVAQESTTVIVTVSSKRYEEVRACITRALSATSPSAIVLISGVPVSELDEKLRADYPVEVYWKIKIHPMAGLGPLPSTSSVPASRVPELVRKRRALGVVKPE